MKSEERILSYRHILFDTTRVGTSPNLEVASVSPVHTMTIPHLETMPSVVSLLVLSEFLHFIVRLIQIIIDKIILIKRTMCHEF